MSSIIYVERETICRTYECMSTEFSELCEYQVIMLVTPDGGLKVVFLELSGIDKVLELFSCTK
jgi:hypothetical protein